MTRLLMRTALLSCAMTLASVASGNAEDPTPGFLGWLLAVKESADNPLSVTTNSSLKPVSGAGYAAKFASPGVAGVATVANGIGMASDIYDVNEYSKKKNAGNAAVEESRAAGRNWGEFAEKSNVPVIADLGKPMADIGSYAAVNSNLTSSQITCKPQPSCLVSLGMQKEAELNNYRNRQLGELSNRQLITPALPKIAQDSQTILDRAVDAGQWTVERVGPAVGKAASAVSEKASAIGNWFKDNSAATFNNTTSAPSAGSVQPATSTVPTPQPAASGPQPQVQTQPAAPQATPTPAPATTPVVTPNAPQQIIVPRHQATVTTRQVPTAQPVAPTAAPAPAQPQASTQPITSPATKADSPWQQQQRADAAAAAAIAAERPAGLSQGQPAIGGIQSDKIWYDGSEGFGGLYELDPKLKAQQAIDYTEKNYAEAVSVDGQPFGMQPSPDPFGDLVPDAADAIQPEEPVQKRDVPPEPVEQAGADDENFDSLSSDPDPYNAPVRQPKYDGYTRPGPGRGDRCGPGQFHAAAVDTPNPGSAPCW